MISEPGSADTVGGAAAVLFGATPASGGTGTTGFVIRRLTAKYGLNRQETTEE